MLKKDTKPVCWKNENFGSMVKKLFHDRNIKERYFLFFCCFIFFSPDIHAQNDNNQPSEPALLPVPQKVSLSNQYYSFDDSWSARTIGVNQKNSPAFLSLNSELKDRFEIRLKKSPPKGSPIIALIIKPGSVNFGKTTDTNVTSLKKQAYRLKLENRRVTIEANSDQGLFYGVQTFIQLLHENEGIVTFEGGEITDWPDMDMRVIYWDVAHHLEHIAAMKRAILQASFFKINAFSLKLEGHFEFSAAKPIVEPYAYSHKEYQELTDYAKAHYVELIPYLDAPAHISFILKHQEYANLRSFPNSNYELDVTNPKADDLILGMVDNLIAANKGGKYFFLSTDEAYYVGKAANQKKLSHELGGDGKLLAKYISRISGAIHRKGRKVIIWGEYPLIKSDVTSLPSHLINGINSNSDVFG